MFYKGKVLVSVNDSAIYNTIKNNLLKINFETIKTSKVKNAIECFHKEAPSLVITDTEFPDGEGLDLIKEIIRTSNIPVIVVSIDDNTFTKTLYLEMGADDYIVYPFDNNEFNARIKAVNRRYYNKNGYDSELVFKGMSINISRYELTVMGNKITIPPKELELLYFLASKPNVVFTREQLLDKIWGYDYFGDSRTVDVHIKRIREKLKGYDNYWEIETVWRIGYKFIVK